jgi:hypothetical protein
VTEPFETSRSLASVTPESVPPDQVVRSSAEPEVWKRPPVMAPPASCQEPVVSSRVSVLDVLSRLPVSLTVPRVRLKAPREAIVIEPPREVVESVAEIVPRFVQGVAPKTSRPPSSSVALEAVIDPVGALVQAPRRESRSPPSAESLPWFSK